MRQRLMSADADCLLHWCYRLDGTRFSKEMAGTSPTPEEIAAMARQAGVRKLILTYFRVNMDAAFDPALLQSGDLAALEAEIAEDLKSYMI